MWSCGGPILSWRWPVDCDAADEVAISARVGLAGERKCRRYQEDCIFVVVACIKGALRCTTSLSMDLNFLVDGKVVMHHEDGEDRIGHQSGSDDS